MKRISVTLSDTDVKILAELARTEAGKGRHAWDLASKTGRNVHTIISALEKLERLGLLTSRREKNERNVPRVAYELTGLPRAFIEASHVQGLQLIRTALILKGLYPRASTKEALATGFVAFLKLNHFGPVLMTGPDNLSEVRDELKWFRDRMDLLLKALPPSETDLGHGRAATTLLTVQRKERVKGS